MNHQYNAMFVSRTVEDEIAALFRSNDIRVSEEACQEIVIAFLKDMLDEPLERRLNIEGEKFYAVVPQMGLAKSLLEMIFAQLDANKELRSFLAHIDEMRDQNVVSSWYTWDVVRYPGMYRITGEDYRIKDWMAMHEQGK